MEENKLLTLHDGLRLVVREPNGEISAIVKIAETESVKSKLLLCTVPSYGKRAMVAPFADDSIEAKIIYQLASSFSSLFWSDKEGGALTYRQEDAIAYKAAVKTFNAVYKKLLGQIDPVVLKAVRRYPSTARAPMLQWLLAEGEYAVQLSYTFPLLAVMLAKKHVVHLRFLPIGNGFMSTEYVEMMEMLRAGCRLNKLAEKMDVPYGLRKLQPHVAASVASYHHAQRKISSLLNIFPSTHRLQQRWMAVFHAAGLEYGDNINASDMWLLANVPKNTTRIPETRQMVFSLCDWMRVNREAFHPKISFATALQRQEEWHRRLQEDARERNVFGRYDFHAEQSINFPVAPLGNKAEGLIAISQILNSADLMEEGRMMDHCVGSYVNRVGQGDCYIYSVQKEGKRVATLEVANDHGVLRMGQLQGYKNTTVPATISKEVTKWLKSHKVAMPRW